MSMKRLGLIVIATMAFAGFAGASSASATVLCKQNLTPCGAANEIPSGTKVVASALSGVVLETNMWNLNCNQSSIEGTAGAGGQTRQSLSVQHMTLSGCFTGTGMACSNTAVFLPWNTALEAIGKGNGNWYAGNAGFTQVCGFQINCTYSFTGGTTTSAGKVTGGNPAKLAVSAPLSMSGGFCPTSAKLVGTYTVTTPSPLYVATS